MDVPGSELHVPVPCIANGLLIGVAQRTDPTPEYALFSSHESIEPRDRWLGEARLRPVRKRDVQRSGVMSRSDPADYHILTGAEEHQYRARLAESP